MKLSLVLATFAAAAIGTDATPQPKSSKGVEPDHIVRMVTVSGECTKLVHAGQLLDGCERILINMNYSTGVSAYWFMTERTVLSFSGDGSRRIERGPNRVVQSIDRIILAVTNGTEDDARESAAVGFCRFSDPTEKGAMLECLAHTEAGLSEGTFTADGLAPKFDEFPVSIR
jgi:hypothetical protein